MGKRGNNEGTITKRKDGRWEARISLPDGKRKCFYGKTHQDVARRLSEAHHEVESGLPLLNERQTLGQYLETWLETVKSQIRPSSWRRYSDLVRVHPIPALGKTVLSKLTAQQVQLFYTRKVNSGLSPTTVHHIHGMLHRALKDALRLGLVQRNVTEMVNAPRREHHEMATLSEEQSRQLLDAVAGDRFEALYVLALTTGMRQGELLALRWQDVDLEGATLQVRINVQEAGGKYILAEPKTSYSRRRIALSQLAVAAVRAHRIEQNKERLALGAVWDTSLDLVFPNAIGGVMIPDNLAKRSFKRYLAKAGLPPIRFHDLRHTAATLLLSRGINPKVLCEMLGHANISITLRVYAHVTPHMQQGAADVMDGLFKRA
jgi:integrase